MINKFLPAVLIGLSSFCFSCASPKRPTTNTAAPSLNDAQRHNRLIYNDVTDAKGSVRHARSLADEIDAKVIKWDSGR
jgi:hypothetical protein